MIAYYAHSHGNGHSNFANQFVENLEEPHKSLIITSSEFKFSTLKVVYITDENMCNDIYIKTCVPLPTYAHYLPKNLKKLAIRNRDITECIIDYNINFAFIDVSVETAAIFRLSGVPYAYRRMIGNRNDQAHLIAYKAAEFLFAYYPKCLELGSYPSKLKEKTIYTGFISRFKFNKIQFNSLKIFPKNELKVLILAGMGGSKINFKLIKKISAALPTNKIIVIGGMNYNTNKSINNVTFLGYKKKLERFINQAHIVISSCGLNLSSEILALKNKFIAIPEDRPFDEQLLFCKSLEAAGLVIKYDKDNIEKCVEDLINLRPKIDLENCFGSIKSLSKKINFKDDV